MQALEKSSFTRVNAFQDNIALGLPNDWRCRSGARYLYICENGLVHYCSQQRGYPAVPLATYTKDDLRREYLDGEIVRAELYGSRACIRFRFSTRGGLRRIRGLR